MRKIAFLFIFIWGSQFTQAQIINAFEGRKTRILFLLDASGSMLAEMEDVNRWAVAVTLLSNMADSLRQVQDVEIGLRVFGHNKPNSLRDCNDTKLEVPFRHIITSNFDKSCAG